MKPERPVHEFDNAAEGFKYMGCFEDDSLNWDFKSERKSVLHRGYCRSEAILKGWKYFALQFGGYCIQSKTPLTYTKKLESECNMPCAEKIIPCGGFNRNSIYSFNNLNIMQEFECDVGSAQ